MCILSHSDACQIKQNSKFILKTLTILDAIRTIFQLYKVLLRRIVLVSHIRIHYLVIDLRISPAVTSPYEDDFVYINLLNTYSNIRNLHNMILEFDKNGKWEAWNYSEYGEEQHPVRKHILLEWYILFICIKIQYGFIDA